MSFLTTHGITVVGTGTSTTVFPDSIAFSVVNGRDTLQIESGTEVKVTNDPQIGPRLYFSWVKTRFKEAEIKNIERRIAPLKNLIEGADLSGQRALYEELMVNLAVLLRVQEAALSFNCSRYINEKDINKFMRIVRNKTVCFVELSKFPRPLPKMVAARLKTIKDRKLFDEFWVLYNNPTLEPALKTNKEKIVEKDPILLGKFSYDSSGNYYHIASWEDEHCDLTLAKFCAALDQESVGEPYRVGKVKPITIAEADRIKKEVMDRHKRLSTTKGTNWRENAAAEEKSWYKGKLSKFFSIFKK